jgi:GNAT superfamily N-acetyltransferase
LIAEHGSVWIGTVTGLANQDGVTNGASLLVAMFVVISARRQGIGVQLVDALSSWARNCGANQLALWVTSGNVPAIALYQRCGFQFTGEAKPLAHTPTLIERRMVLQL